LERPVIPFFFLPEVIEFRPLITSLFDLIQKQFEVKFIETEELVQDALIFDLSSGYPLKREVYTKLGLLRPCPELFQQGLHICFETDLKKIDPLASAFSILHCLSEQNLSDAVLDKYGRLTYENSLYKAFHSSYEDLVSPLFRIFLKDYCHIENIRSMAPRSVILTHDIDFLTSGFKQEFKFFLKNPSWSLGKALFKHLFGSKKIWNNISEIISLERTFGVKSTFYLLPNEGFVKNIRQADYGPDILKSTAESILTDEMEVGLHKSSSDHSYLDEAAKFKRSEPFTNRNHFLKYTYPKSWKEMAVEGVEVDTGLGWSDAPGLRNGYPFPFIPFVKPYGIQVVPLVLMDTSFDNFNQNSDIVESFKKMIDQWNNGYTVSVLFHNNYLTPWSNKYFLDQYIEFLKYLTKEGIEVKSTSQINSEQSETI